jgi:cyclohexanone monooxygenase
VGCLSATNIPDFPGLDVFEGEQYHTSHWPRQGPDLTGRRIGIVGTGSSGIQAITAMAKIAAHLYVFQRTPNFSLPSNNAPMDPEYEANWKRHYTEHRLRARASYGGTDTRDFLRRSAMEFSEDERNAVYEEAWAEGAFAMPACFTDLMTNVDANATAAEFVRNKIRGIVRDQEVAELLAPKDYPIFTKRICMDTGYYEVFNQDNVTLVDVKSNRIETIIPKGLRTKAAEYEFDILVFATGFDAITGPLLRMNIIGRGGEALRSKWEAGPRTYLGLAASGFPNLFMVTGPGSPSVLTNMMTSIEQHVGWIAQTIKYLRENDLATIEATLDAEDKWVEHVNQLADVTLFKSANSWYLGSNIPGKPRVFMPYVGGVGAYRQKCNEVAENGYEGFVLST